MEFPEKVVTTLTARTKSFIEIFNKGIFPIDIELWGYPKVHIEDSKECLARILELSELINFKGTLKMNKETNKAEITY